MITETLLTAVGAGSKSLEPTEGTAQALRPLFPHWPPTGYHFQYASGGKLFFKNLLGISK